jgi:hypothetical protein
MTRDYSTRTEHDAAISAGFDAYPDDRPSRADLAEESAWWDWWWREGRHQEVDPHGWPREASERVIATLTAARCRDCDGSGEVPTGRIPADLFGPAEPILTRCPTCDGTGYPESETA